MYSAVRRSREVPGGGGVPARHLGAPGGCAVWAFAVATALGTVPVVRRLGEKPRAPMAVRFRPLPRLRRVGEKGAPGRSSAHPGPVPLPHRPVALTYLRYCVAPDRGTPRQRDGFCPRRG